VFAKPEDLFPVMPSMYHVKRFPLCRGRNDFIHRFESPRSRAAPGQSASPSGAPRRGFAFKLVPAKGSGSLSRDGLVMGCGMMMNK
jgi:hypothetical protein